MIHLSYRQSNPISAEQAKANKDQIVDGLFDWGRSYGYYDEQILSLTSALVAHAIQYSFNIGKNTEVSALKSLWSELQTSLTRLHPDAEGEVMIILFAFATRYAQVEKMLVE